MNNSPISEITALSIESTWCIKHLGNSEKFIVSALITDQSFLLYQEYSAIWYKGISIWYKKIRI